MTPAEEAHKLRVIGYLTKIRRLWQQAEQEIAAMAGTIKNYDPTKPYTVANYPQTKATMDKWMAKLHDETKSIIEEGIDNEWYQANIKNDDLVKGWTKGKPKPPAEWMQHNEEARDAFKMRKEAGMSLSGRVWKLTDEYKGKIEVAIDMSLFEGKSAQLLSQDVKKYLNNPDKLFRRVRDEKGVLQLSKAAKAYHPGQGVYRSSHKNAMRIARTEHNLAYRYSDFYRTNQLDFVVGFEVHLSNNHTLNGVPFTDVCDDLKGKYPKTFKFGGWHPQCRCYTTQILMDQDEFDAQEDKLLAGEDISGYVSPKTVTDPPDGFDKWVKGNLTRSQGWKQQPYWVRDNFKGGNLAGGLAVKAPKFSIPAAAPTPVPPIAIKPPVEPKTAPVKAIKAATEAELNEWQAKINQVLKQYGATVPSIDKYSSTIINAISQGKSKKEIGAMMSKMDRKVTIKKKWDARRAANAKKFDKQPFLDELKSIDATFYDSPAIRAMVKDIKLRLKAGTNKTYFDKQMEILRHKTEVKKLWDERRTINQMGDLFPDAKAAVQQYGLKETKAAYDYVKSKIAFWKAQGYDLQKMVSKFEYEITYVEQMKAHPTWKLAQDAYKKQLQVVKAEYQKTQYLLEKTTIEASVKDALAFSKTSASPMLHDLINNLDNLLKADAPIKDIQFAAKQVNAKYGALKTLKDKRSGMTAPKPTGTTAASGTSDVGNPSAYSKARKDAAAWSDNERVSDNRFRPSAERHYANASNSERLAGYHYTMGSGKFNRPLRGYAGDWNHKKPGVSLNYEGAAHEITNLTSWLERSSVDFDCWLQRGIGSDSLGGMLGDIDVQRMSISQLNKLIGKDFYDDAFLSCSPTKGFGFSGSDVILNIYCPKGTKMTYAEPWSHYGGYREYKTKWDGKQKQNTIRSEQEVIIQRGTTVRIVKIEKRGNKFYIDVEVVAQKSF